MSSAGQQLVAGRIPGERIATEVQTVDSAGFTAETVIMTVVAPVVTGRTYLVRGYVSVASETDNDDVQLRIREDSISGNQLQEDGFELTHDLQSTRGQHQVIEAEYTADATENKTFVVTAELAAGTGDLRREAAANKPSYLYLNYVEG